MALRMSPSPLWLELIQPLASTTSAQPPGQRWVLKQNGRALNKGFPCSSFHPGCNARGPFQGLSRVWPVAGNTGRFRCDPAPSRNRSPSVKRSWDEKSPLRRSWIPVRRTRLCAQRFVAVFSFDSRFWVELGAVAQSDVFGKIPGIKTAKQAERVPRPGFPRRKGHKQRGPLH